MSFSNKIVALGGVRVSGNKLVGPIKTAYFSMIDKMSFAIGVESLQDIGEIYYYFAKLFSDRAVNKEGYEVPLLNDIYKNGRFFLNEELRMNIINLINRLPDIYFNDEIKLSENKEIAKVVFAVLKASALSAFDTIEQKINLGKINPNKENPNRLFFAGTGNPMHHAHIITMLEALAYSENMDTVEVLIHSIDPRKTDLLNFFHRFTMNEDVLGIFAPLVRMHELDKAMHDQLLAIQEKGVEVDNVNLVTAYTADAIIDKNNNRIELSEGSKLEFLPADGESKLFMVMRGLKKGISVNLGYIAGSDHRKSMDTHKKNLGLMLDTIGKIALEVKAQNNDKTLGFNKKDHTISYVCNVRDPKKIDNNALMMQFGLSLLDLEHSLLSPEKLESAMKVIQSGDEPMSAVIIGNMNFIETNMKNYSLTQEYIRSKLTAVSGDEMLGSFLIYNVDDSSDKTVFTLQDAIDTNGANKNEVIGFIDTQKAEILKKDLITKEDLNDLSLRIMKKVLNIGDLSDDGAVLAAIEKFLGIKLETNFASTSFSSTQVRDYFTGSTESWAAIWLPSTTMEFIAELMGNSEYSGYSSDAENPYGIANAVSNKATSGVRGVLQKVRL